jgi:hypothetical protein
MKNIHSLKFIGIALMIFCAGIAYGAIIISANMMISKKIIIPEYHKKNNLPEKEIRSLSGEVIKVENSTIYLDVWQNELLASGPMQREINAQSAKIYKLVKDDSPEYIVRLESYYKKVIEAKKENSILPAGIVEPQPFVKKEMKISDLKKGQLLSVLAGENIRQKNNFVAVEIVVQ